MKTTLPKGITEEDATLLVEGAQKYLRETVLPAESEELFYGPTTDARPDPTPGRKPLATG